MLIMTKTTILLFVITIGLSNLTNILLKSGFHTYLIVVLKDTTICHLKQDYFPLIKASIKMLTEDLRCKATINLAILDLPAASNMRVLTEYFLQSLNNYSLLIAIDSYPQIIILL